MKKLISSEATMKKRMQLDKNKMMVLVGFRCLMNGIDLIKRRWLSMMVIVPNGSTTLI